MGAQEDPRESNKQRDRKIKQADSPTGEKQDSEKSDCHRGVTGWKRLKILSKFGTAPDFFHFDRRTDAAGRDLECIGRSTSQSSSGDHGKKNARPLLIA